MHLTTQQQQSYRKIKAYLLAPERRVGERLVERKLGELVGASRTPVRQALIQLAQEGLVEHAPQWGFFVRQPDEDEFGELYDIRLRLESYAARRAAVRATAEDLKGLRETSTVSRAPHPASSCLLPSRTTITCIDGSCSPKRSRATEASASSRNDSRGGSKPQRVNAITPSSVRWFR